MLISQWIIVDRKLNIYKYNIMQLLEINFTPCSVMMLELRYKNMFSAWEHACISLLFACRRHLVFSYSINAAKALKQYKWFVVFTRLISFMSKFTRTSPTLKRSHVSETTHITWALLKSLYMHMSTTRLSFLYQPTTESQNISSICTFMLVVYIYCYR